MRQRSEVVGGGESPVGLRAVAVFEAIKGMGKKEEVEMMEAYYRQYGTQD